MQSFTVSELIILGNSKKIGGAWYYPAAWTFHKSDTLAGYGYINASLNICGCHGGVIIRDPVNVAAHRRGSSWDVLIETAERMEA